MKDERGLTMIQANAVDAIADPRNPSLSAAARALGKSPPVLSRMLSNEHVKKEALKLRAERRDKAKDSISFALSTLDRMSVRVSKLIENDKRIVQDPAFALTAWEKLTKVTSDLMEMDAKFNIRKDDSQHNRNAYDARIRAAIRLGEWREKRRNRQVASQP